MVVDPGITHPAATRGAFDPLQISANRSPTSSVLDSSAFPHILQRTVDLAPFDAQLAFRAVSRALRDAIDARLFEHVVLVAAAARYAEAKTGVSFASPAPPHRLLPCIPSVRQLPRPKRRRESESEGEARSHPRSQSAAHLASNRRIMACIRILDSATEKLYDLPTLPPVALVRKCAPRAAGLAAHTIVETLFLTAAEEECAGVANAWDRFRYLVVTPTGTTPTGAANGGLAARPEALDEGGTFIAHLEYDAAAPPRRGIVLDVRRRNALRNLVIVFPEVPPDTPWSLGEVVEGVRVTVMMALPRSRGWPGMRVTLVGVERFGARHFGVPDNEGAHEATRSALLAHCRLDPYDPRLECLSYDDWVAGVRSEVRAPPPEHSAAPSAPGAPEEYAT